MTPHTNAFMALLVVSHLGAASIATSLQPVSKLLPAAIGCEARGSALSAKKVLDVLQHASEPFPPPALTTSFSLDFAAKPVLKPVVETLIASGAQMKKLAGGFTFTEGPAVDAEGNIYFSDIPNSRIHKWSLEDGLSTFREDTEEANGLFFESDGTLLACQSRAGRRLVQYGRQGTLTQIAATYQGKRFNSCNDLWPDPQGGIYFTDPRYGPKRDDMEQDGEHVYYLKPDRRTLIRVIDDMVRPNGIIGTPDGKTLYVADHGAGKTYAYAIQREGTLAGKRLFAKRGSDGVTLDERGNLYLTTQAVYIHGPNGKELGSISVPERPTNCCFGGRNGKTLFITAQTSLYSIEMQVKGAHVPSP